MPSDPIDTAGLRRHATAAVSWARTLGAGKAAPFGGADLRLLAKGTLALLDRIEELEATVKGLKRAVDRLTRENTVFRAAVVIEQADDDTLDALLENTDVDDLLAFMRVCDAIGLAETPGE